MRRRRRRAVRIVRGVGIDRLENRKSAIPSRPPPRRRTEVRGRPAVCNAGCPGRRILAARESWIETGRIQPECEPSLPAAGRGEFVDPAAMFSMVRDGYFNDSAVARGLPARSRRILAWVAWPGDGVPSGYPASAQMPFPAVHFAAGGPKRRAASLDRGTPSACVWRLRPVPHRSPDSARFAA